ncbi:hypothetical protein C8R44DRAFT_752746 [Mycena epipterygia]|nr:hypothetical protein C8R44DRAFT_752746 [Mycena epipterygia]
MPARQNESCSMLASQLGSHAGMTLVRPETRPERRPHALHPKGRGPPRRLINSSPAAAFMFPVPPNLSNATPCSSSLGVLLTRPAPRRALRPPPRSHAIDPLVRLFPRTRGRNTEAADAQDGACDLNAEDPDSSASAYWWRVGARPKAGAVVMSSIFYPAVQLRHLSFLVFDSAFCIKLLCPAPSDQRAGYQSSSSAPISPTPSTSEHYESVQHHPQHMPHHHRRHQNPPPICVNSALSCVGTAPSAQLEPRLARSGRPNAHLVIRGLGGVNQDSRSITRTRSTSKRRLRTPTSGCPYASRDAAHLDRTRRRTDIRSAASNYS